MRVGTIVRFMDGRVAVKKVTGVWEVTGSTMPRMHDSELEAFTVVFVPPRDVSGYGLGTAVLVDGVVFVKIVHSVVGSMVYGEWASVLDDVLRTNVELAATDFVVLHLGETYE